MQYTKAEITCNSPAARSTNPDERQAADNEGDEQEVDDQYGVG